MVSVKQTFRDTSNELCKQFVESVTPVSQGPDKPASWAGLWGNST